MTDFQGPSRAEEISNPKEVINPKLTPEGIQNFERHMQVCPKCSDKNPDVSLCETGFKLLKESIKLDKVPEYMKYVVPNQVDPFKEQA